MAVDAAEQRRLRRGNGGGATGRGGRLMGGSTYEGNGPGDRGPAGHGVGRTPRRPQVRCCGSASVASAGKAAVSILNIPSRCAVTT
jgi:hypothetical protein